MYFCRNCTRFLDQPIRLEERYGLFKRRGAIFEGCPYCKEAGMLEEVAK